MDHHMLNYAETVKYKSNKTNPNSKKVLSTQLQWTAELKCYKMKRYCREVCNFS